MTHDHDTPSNGPGPTPAIGDDALRWQLRGLRRDEAPTRDLWPGIAARLSQQRPSARVRPRWRWQAPVALAASVLLVVGTLGWFGRAPVELAAPSPTLVQREADHLTRQYQAALLELQPTPDAGAVPASLAPTMRELDRNAALIRDALARDPDSVRLLEQLRRTYAHRLALVQRLSYT